MLSRHFDLTADINKDCKDSATISVSTDKMISLIRERPFLWDKTDAGYRYNLRRVDAWSEVYRELYPNYDNLKAMQKARIRQKITNRWYTVRSAYVKSIKVPEKRPCEFSNAMSFLDKVIFGDRYNTSDYLEEQSLEGEPQVWLNETFIDVDASAQEPATKKSKPDYSCFLEAENVTVAPILSKKPTSEYSGFLEDENDTVAPILSKKPKSEYPVFLEDENDTVAPILTKMINREEDEDRAFFTSITSIVKALPDNAKLEFRIEVMQLIKKLKNDKNKGIVVKTNDSDSE